MSRCNLHADTIRGIALHGDALVSAAQIPTPKVLKRKIPPLSTKGGVRCGRSVCHTLVLPLGGSARLLAACSSFTPHTRAALHLVASLLWSSRKDLKIGASIMCVVKAAARRFIDRVDHCTNAASFVAEAWGCEASTRGCNVLGKVANTWHVPQWCDGSSEEVTVRLSPLQRHRWDHRADILRECMDAANPHAALVRKTLATVTLGPTFDNAAQKLGAKGERNAVRNYRKKPHQLNVTRDEDVQSNVSRLPEMLRAALQIDGHPVAEFDVKSAHAVLLGMLYADQIGEAWDAEHARFAEEVLRGFPSIYGEGESRKNRKRQFLAALNQPNLAAHHASPGYRELERLFPLLAEKMRRMKRYDKNAVGRRLRCALAKIQKLLLLENDGDGIPSIPVVDSVLVASPDTPWLRHQAAFRTAWRLAVPIHKLTGTSPLIEGSNGENFRFIL